MNEERIQHLRSGLNSPFTLPAITLRRQRKARRVERGVIPIHNIAHMPPEYCQLFEPTFSIWVEPGTDPYSQSSPL